MLSQITISRQERGESEGVGDEAWASLHTEVQDLTSCREALARAALEATNQVSYLPFYDQGSRYTVGTYINTSLINQTTMVPSQ